MEQRVSRRGWFTALASGAGAVAAACQRNVTEVVTEEGKVLQYEGDDMLVLVSGIGASYRLGDTINLTVIVNNQTARLAEVRIRTKLLGRGDQPVVQLDPAVFTVKPDDATRIDQQLPLAKNLPTGDYVVNVEVPPWRLDGRETGRGANLRSNVRVDPAT